MQRREEGRERRKRVEQRESMSLFYGLQQMDHKVWGLVECPSSCDLSLGSQKFNLTKLLYLMFCNHVLTFSKLHHLKSRIFVFVKRCDMLMIIQKD